MTSAAATDYLANFDDGGTFDLNAEQREILDQADRYARNELYPLSEKMDAEEWWPDDIFPKMGAAGFFGITVPEEYGGVGMDLVTSGLLVQAFGRWNHALALSWVAHENLCLNNIYRNANEEQRRKYLPDLCSGRKIGALGLTEPGAGSDALGSMRTTARRDGDHYVLNGTKIYITNGPVADVVLVYAKTDKERGAHGISAFIVEKGFPGFEVAQKLGKMGYRGSQTAELVFNDCRVPAENRLGEENRGVSIVMSGLDLERSMIAPICLGVFRARSGTVDRIRPDPQTVWQTDRELPDGAVDDRRDVCGGRDDAHLHLPDARRRRAAGSRRRRPRRHSHAHGRIGSCTRLRPVTRYSTRRCRSMADRVTSGNPRSTGSTAPTSCWEIGAGTTEVRKMIIAGELLKDVL